MSLERSRTELLAGVESAARDVERGAVRVEQAQASLRFDERDESPFVLLLLRLAPPREGRATWPVDDMYEVRRLVRDRLVPLDLPYPVRMSYLDATSDEARDDGVEARSGAQLSADLRHLGSGER